MAAPERLGVRCASLVAAWLMLLSPVAASAKTPVPAPAPVPTLALEYALYDSAAHDSATHDSAAHDSATHDGATHDGATHDGATHDGATHDGAPGGSPREASRHVGDAAEPPTRDMPHEFFPQDDDAAQAEILSARAPATSELPPVVPEATRWPSHVSAYPRRSPYRTLGAYDWALTRRVLREEGAVPEHLPEGKTICEIHYRPQDIFLPDEPFPLFLNALHATTRVSTVAAATPFEVGDTYSELLREDVRLELGIPAVYSAAVVVPTTSADEGCVDVYVITRDLWSLQAGIEPRLSGGTIEYLGLALVEANFLGLNDTLGVNFVLEPGSWELGPVWSSERFLDSPLSAAAEFRLIFDREEGGLEGGMSAFSLARPLRSSWDKHAWRADISHRNARGRVFDGGQLQRLDYADPDSGVVYTVDERWEDVQFAVEGGYTRSFGLRSKHLLSAGAFVDLRATTPAPNDPTIPAAVLELFAEDRLPRSERAIGLRTGWEFYQNKHFYRTNYDSFGVSEGYRGGLSLRAELRYSEPTLGASVRFLQSEVGVGFVQPIGEDALWSIASVAGLRVSARGWTDRRVEVSTRLALPSGVAGRFVLRAWGRYLHMDTANDRFRVGAVTTLRGYAGHAAEGHNAWLTNLEWRSKPVQVLSLFFGLAAFLDVAGAWERADDLSAYASVGLGLRFFMPQAMSRPGSIDVAFPIGRGAWADRMPGPVISLRFGHAFLPVETLSIEELWR